MIDARRLLEDLKPLQRKLEEDLRVRCDENAELDALVRAEYRKGQEGERTAATYESFREELLTQVAAAWILACVFVRFLEDNGLIEPPRIAGPGERLQRAHDQHTLYVRDAPTDTDREYLLQVFTDLSDLPALEELFRREHNPLWLIGPSGDAAQELLLFFQKIDPASGDLIHEFTDPAWDTRFLGDLYQDLSESARKRYALLQTPEFVEEFLLERTLDPAIETFGYREVRLIDPACGSGHFLLGAFEKLLRVFEREEPGTNERERVRRVLGSIYGVDVNPFAVAIARFRLLVAALRACGLHRLAEAPNFHFELAAGNSLLMIQRQLDADEEYRNLYTVEDPKQLRKTFGQKYHVVVGNPPYITEKDKQRNARYRDRFSACHRQYSLVVPFAQLAFDELVAEPFLGARNCGGFVGLIVANSFMKREFGKKLIEGHMWRWDLTHVIDTSGASIPGHGTPTVILLGRGLKLPNKQQSKGKTTRAVMGIRGESSTPKDPAMGLVWRAIREQVDQPGSESDFVSVADTPREVFSVHPWSIGGGGAADLKQTLEEQCNKRLSDNIASIGFVCMTRADDVYFTPASALRRHRIQHENIIINVEGEKVRDWGITGPNTALFPYDTNLQPVEDKARSPVIRFLWPHRTHLWLRREPNGNHRELNRTWHEWSRFLKDRYRTPFSITFAFVATHNHFVLDRGGRVFNRTAPVIKLPPEANDDDHLALLGLLNSSTACFWMKQVMTGKHKGDGGSAHADPAYQRFEVDGTKLQSFPVVGSPSHEGARAIDALATSLHQATPPECFSASTPDRQRLEESRQEATDALREMIARQEELDWEAYRVYGLVDNDLTYPGNDLPKLNLGERAFEIVLGRKLARGTLRTSWFERHGSSPLTEIPEHWPADYRRLVERRIGFIETDRNIGLIEQPEYKRRWDTEPWESQLERALRHWLLDRLEGEVYWPAVHLQSCAQLADRARQDPEFVQVAELYEGRSDFDLGGLIERLVGDESVPYLPVLRYKPSGLRKRKQWESTWALQRREDAGEDVREIPVPPKYATADFQKTCYWRLRGKLDVPKERFVSYPHAEREADPTLVVGWAGWNHLQQAEALANYYHRVQDEGWSEERRIPLLAGIQELVPWLLQWHNEVDPTYGEGAGDSYRRFVEDEARALETTIEALSEWTPPRVARKTRRKRRTTT